MANRIFNFNAGPAALPLSVLEEIQASFLDFKGSGMSITEVSHRSPWFDDVINDAVVRMKRLLNLDDRFQVLSFVVDQPKPTKETRDHPIRLQHRQSQVG